MRSEKERPRERERERESEKHEAGAGGRKLPEPCFLPLSAYNLASSRSLHTVPPCSLDTRYKVATRYKI
jgi:hypothetical protein